MDPEIELEYPTLDEVPEAFRPLYKETDGKAVLVGVRGLKTQKDIDNLNEALRKERDSHKQTQSLLKPWKDLKPEEVQAKLDRVAELELAAGGKLDENAINRIAESRLAQKVGPLERKIKDLEEANQALAGERDQFKGSLTDLRMSRAISAAATEAKVIGDAMEDVDVIIKRMVEFTEDGRIITKDGVGVTPGVDLKQLFKEMQQKRPYWFPESVGGGSRGNNRTTPSGGPNPFTHENWNMTEQGKLVRENPEIARQLAKAAGTTVGGPKPPAKKS